MWATRAACVGALALGLAGCDGNARSEREIGGPASDAVELASIKPLDVGPISYFEDSCARCHGAFGDLYALPFVTPDEELPRVIEEMAAGPAQAPLEGAPLAALIDYHRSMRDGLPFAALVGREGEHLVFEVTPDAALEVDGGAATRVGPYLWRVSNASGVMSIRARQGDAGVVLPLGESPWTGRVSD
jgi:hypothetical protein